MTKTIFFFCFVFDDLCKSRTTDLVSVMWHVPLPFILANNNKTGAHERKFLLPAWKWYFINTFIQQNILHIYNIRTISPWHAIWDSPCFAAHIAMGVDSVFGSAMWRTRTACHASDKYLIIIIAIEKDEILLDLFDKQLWRRQRSKKKKKKSPEPVQTLALQ